MLTKRLSSDRSKDTLSLEVDDREIRADGVDATRVWFATRDHYGAMCPCLDGKVTLQVEGPAEKIGDDSFLLAETGGVGCIWIRSKRGQTGTVVVWAIHPRFGTKSVSVRIAPA